MNPLLNTIPKALISNSALLYLRATLGGEGDFIAQWRKLSPKEQDALKNDARAEMSQPHNVLARKRLIEMKSEL
jgi:hypothetical protein